MGEPASEVGDRCSCLAGSAGSGSGSGDDSLGPWVLTGPGGNGSAATEIAGLLSHFTQKSHSLGMNSGIPEASSNNNSVINAARVN